MQHKQTYYLLYCIGCGRLIQVIIVLQSTQKKISHSEGLICHENTQIVELVVIQDMKESKKLWVVAAVTVVFWVIILNYSMFYLGTGIYKKDLSPCRLSHWKQGCWVIAHSLSFIGHQHENYTQRYCPGTSHAGMQLCRGAKRGYLEVLVAGLCIQGGLSWQRSR